MTRVGCSVRLVKRITKRMIKIVTIICGMISRARGLVLVHSKWMASRVNSVAPRCHSLLNVGSVRESRSQQMPTVVNPISKRRIHLGGRRYIELIKEGGWVQHKGTLERIDLEMLRCYQQQDSSFRNEITIPPFEEYSNDEDNWYCIDPVAVRPSRTSIESGVTNAALKGQSLFDETTRENLRGELLFVNKPSHLNCVPSRYHSDSLATRVLSVYPGSKPCHRLDRDTSGIVLFGLTKEAHRDVSKQFEARTTSKTYVALITGCPEQDHGTVSLPIGKKKTKEGFNRWTIGGEKPREAVTHWTIDKVFTDKETGAVFSRVKLKPVTGRGHQLRLHMKAIGCSILGDTIHGEGGVAMCSSRLCLHAEKLQVDWNDIRLEAESVPPF